MPLLQNKNNDDKKYCLDILDKLIALKMFFTYIK